jgi:dihydroneopterin aldolase
MRGRHVETVTYQAVYETLTEWADQPRWVRHKLTKDSVEEVLRHIERERKRTPHRDIRLLQVLKVRTIAEPIEIDGFDPG